MTSKEANILSCREVLQDFHLWQRKSNLQEVSSCLHDLSTHLHVASYCLEELKELQGAGRKDLFMQKLEKSFTELKGELETKREETRQRRECLTPMTTDWEAYFSSFFQVTNEYGATKRPLEVKFGASLEGRDDVPLSFRALPLMSAFQAVAKKMGRELASFFQATKVNFECHQTETEMTVNFLYRGDREIFGLELKCDGRDFSEELFSFFKEFCTKNATIDYKVKELEFFEKSQEEKLLALSLVETTNGGFKGTLQYA